VLVVVKVRRGIAYARWTGSSSKSMAADEIAGGLRLRARIREANPHASLRTTMISCNILGDLEEPGSINLNDAVADGVEGEIGDGVEIEFSHQVGAVGFGGFDA